MYIRTDDPDLSVFYLDPIINPLSCGGTQPKDVLSLHEDAIFGPNGADDDEFEIPDEITPLLEEKGLENEHTADTFTLRWAPAPYNRRSGHTRRAHDVPLVKKRYL